MRRKKNNWQKPKVFWSTTTLSCSNPNNKWIKITWETSLINTLMDRIKRLHQNKWQIRTLSPQLLLILLVSSNQLAGWVLEASLGEVLPGTVLNLEEERSNPVAGEVLELTKDITRMSICQLKMMKLIKCFQMPFKGKVSRALKSNVLLKENITLELWESTPRLKIKI